MTQRFIKLSNLKSIKKFKKRGFLEQKKILINFKKILVIKYFKFK